MRGADDLLGAAIGIALTSFALAPAARITPPERYPTPQTKVLLPVVPKPLSKRAKRRARGKAKGRK